MLPTIIVAAIAFSSVAWVPSIPFLKYEGSRALEPVSINIGSRDAFGGDSRQGMRADLRVIQQERYRWHDKDDEDEQDIICAPTCSITCFAVACVAKEKSGHGSLLPLVTAPQGIPGSEIVRTLRKGYDLLMPRLRLRGGSPNDRRPTVNRTWEKSYQDGQPTIWAAARVGDVEVSLRC